MDGAGVKEQSGPQGPQEIRARARLRQKAQLTLPEEIRRALRIEAGDELEFTVRGDGTITVRGFVSVPTDQVWRYAPHPDESRTPDDVPERGSTRKPAEDALAGPTRQPQTATPARDLLTR